MCVSEDSLKIDFEVGIFMHMLFKGSSDSISLLTNPSNLLPPVPLFQSLQRQSLSIVIVTSFGGFHISKKYIYSVTSPFWGI